MSPRSPHRTVALAACVASVSFVLGVMLLRLPSSFALEWQEGGMLQHVLRVRSGEALYVPPSPDFIPFPYPPLFAWLGSLAVAVLGPELWVLRLVSLLSCLLLAEVVARVVVRLGGGKEGVAIALGTFFAGYAFGGAWLELARVDVLSLALLLLGLERVMEPEGERGATGSTIRLVVAGLCFALATLAKQNALFLPLGLCLFLSPTPRRSLLLGSATLLPLVAAYLWLQSASEGWFRWYLVDQLVGHELHRPALLGFWLELVRALPVALLLGLGGVLLAGPLRGRGLLLTACLALVAMAWSGRAHTGGYDNTLLPALLAACLLAGCGLAGALRSGSLAAALVVLAQLAWLQLDQPLLEGRDLLPGEERARDAELLVEALAEREGPVLAPFCPELVQRAGLGSGGAHGMAVLDLLRSGDGERARDLVQSLEEGLERGRWEVVLVPGSWFEELPVLGQRYRLAGEYRLEPVTGAVHSPLLWAERID